MTGNNKAQQTGMLGVYLAAAELTNRGFIVSPTSRSAAGADLLVTDKSCQTAWSVQVKSQRQAANYWLVGVGAREIKSPSHIYIFVNFRGDSRPEYLVIPSKIVAESIYEDKGFYCFDKVAGKTFVQQQDWPDERSEGWEIFSIPNSESFALPEPAHVTALCSFIPLLDSLSVEQIVRWEGGETNKEGLITMPYPVSAKEVDAFVQVLYALGFITAFDWSNWEDEAQTYANNSDLVAVADLDVCIHLLTTHVRKDRFCGGHLVEMIASGHVVAILKRLQQLNASRIDSLSTQS